MGFAEIDANYLSDAVLFTTLIKLSAELMWVREFAHEDVVWIGASSNLKKFGIRGNKTSQQFWYDNIHPKDLREATNGYKEVMNDPSAVNYVREYRFKGAGKKWHYIRDKVCFVRDKNGKPIRAIGVWEDNTRLVRKGKKEKKLLEELEKDRNRFKIISELSNAVMWEEDFNKKQLFWSGDPKILNDFGVDKGYFPVSEWANHIHPEDAGRSAKRFREAMASPDGIYNDEYRVIKADGSIAHILDRGMIIRDKGNNPVRAIGGWVDITKERLHQQGLENSLRELEGLNRKLSKREEELATSEEELRLLNEELSNKNKVLTDRDQVITRLQHLAKIGSWEYNPNTDEFTASPEAYAIQGLSEDDPVTVEEIIQFYDEEGRRVLLDTLGKVRKGEGEPFDLVLKSSTPVGNTIWVRICAWTSPNREGLPSVIGLTYDITKFKEAEILLKSSEEKFSSAFHNNPDLMILMRKEDFKIIDINSKIGPILAYDREELVGRQATDFRFFVHQDDREYFFKHFDDAGHFELEAGLIRKDGAQIQAMVSFSTFDLGGTAHVIMVIKDISDRKIAEEKFSKVFYNNPDAMMLIRKEGMVMVDVNEKTFPITGYKRSEFLGRSIAEFDTFAYPHENEKFWEIFNRHNKVEMEAAWKKKDGQVIHIMISMEQLDISGVEHMIAIIRDISDRKVAEEKFSKIFYHNPDAMMLIRKRDMVMVDVNDRSLPITGYERSEFLGRPIWDFDVFVDLDERQAFWDSFEKNLKAEREAAWKKKDGQVIHVVLSMEQLDIGGEDHIIAMVKDITERKIAEERFAKAFDLSPDLMFIFREKDYVLVACNKHVELVSGYGRDEIIGKSSLDFRLWAQPEDRERFFNEYFGQDNSVFMESQFLRKDGTVFIGNISARRIVLQGENHMLVIVRDITERKITEHKVIESEANLYAVINNSNLLVWSVDLDYRVIKANSRFESFVWDNYQVKVVPGQKLVSEDPMTDKRLKAIWLPRYERVLSGEKYRITDVLQGRHVEFSLGPIMDNGHVIGIVVFAEDITERVTRERALKNALNKVAEFKLMALRSVMNPHFFFNALSSIQYFIAQNDRKNAINYLSTFSQLVRGILEHSVSNTISLAKEISQLKNYIVLEQLRFENKFDYRIDIDNELDLEGIEIPSLLVQPYVENAIIHGLYNKQERGLLTISISKENDALLFQVKDNGVGRKKSMEINKKNRFGHKSLGAEITGERLKLINNKYKVSFEILDMVDETGQPEGTTVKIWLAG